MDWMQAALAGLTEERRAIRMSECGIYTYDYLTKNGEVCKSSRVCRCRECPNCHAWRAKMEGTRVAKAFEEHGKVYTLTLPIAERAEFRLTLKNAGLTKYDYRIIPQEDDTVVCFWVKWNECGGDEVTTANQIAEIDWDAICWPAEGKRSSGQLGNDLVVPVETDPNSQVESVQAMAVSAPDATDSQRAEAIFAAMSETSYLDPHTREELEKAATLRAEAQAAAYERMGLEVSRRTVWRKVDLAAISWYIGTIATKSNYGEAEGGYVTDGVPQDAFF